MKVLRGCLVLTLSALAVLTLLAALQPRESAQAAHTAATLDVVINEVAWGGLPQCQPNGSA
jgi:hypothetical protein